MTSPVKTAFVLGVGFPVAGYFLGTSALYKRFTHTFSLASALLLVAVYAGVYYYVFVHRGSRGRGALESDSGSVYGLEHGRLHIGFPTAMWMNMGYWAHDDEDGNENEGSANRIKVSKSMAEACRDLLREVLSTAGFTLGGVPNGMQRTKCLIDLGFGCGDQTIALMSNGPVSRSDEDWWDGWGANVGFDRYVGVTVDRKQHRFAEGRVEAMKKKAQENGTNLKASSMGVGGTKVFCGDAAKPEGWSPELRTCVQDAVNETQDCWVLALDTAYHFSPSRWPLISYAFRSLNASIMAFDLCLSPKASFTQILVLRILTALMGAPWANFVTPDQYRRKLVEAGYQEDQIILRDVSQYVFGPLAEFLEEHDRKLRMVGFGIGSFKVAKRMFKWWGNSGLIRGVIVVAKKDIKQ